MKSSFCANCDENSSRYTILVIKSLLTLRLGICKAAFCYSKKLKFKWKINGTKAAETIWSPNWVEHSIAQTHADFLKEIKQLTNNT